MQRKKLILGVVALALLLGTGWALGWFSSSKYSPDPKVAELEKLRDKNVIRPAQPPDAERRAEGEDFRKKIQGLSENQRQEFMERSMPVFMERARKDFDDRYNKLMAMSPDDRRKELDKSIDRMEQMRQSGERRGAPPKMDPEKMEQMRKKMLDWTTPDMRAKFENGMQMMNERRRERGLPPMSGPGGGMF